MTINNLKRQTACTIFSELQQAYSSDRLNVTQFNRNEGTFLIGDQVICPPAVSGVVMGGERNARNRTSVLRVAARDIQGNVKEIFVDTTNTFHNFKIAGRTAHKNPCRQASGEKCWSAAELKLIARNVKKQYPDDVEQSVGNTKSENIELMQCFIAGSKQRRQIVSEIAKKLL